VDSLQGKLGRHVDWAGTRFAISAGPTLLVDGQECIAPASEGFTDPGLYGYRMRAAMGVTPANKLLLLTTCRPVSLHELARIFQQLGAVDAVNLDGGSSTALVYDGQVKARPSRRLTNLIAVYEAGTAPSQAAGLGDQYAAAYNTSLKAIGLFRQGDLVKAHSQMRKAISMAPDRAPYWETLAQIQEASGKPFEAADSYVKAAQLYLERSQMSKVQEAANHAFRLDPSLQATHPELSKLAGEASLPGSL
jgi:tetratricopeptide (TPR) repeat protein